MTFKDQRAVVTGANGGIGREIAMALAGKGAIVCLVGRRAERLAEVAERISRTGGRSEIYPCDLSVDEDVRKLASKISGEPGGAAILVHCAGAISMGTLEHSRIEDLDALYRINVRAPYLLTKSLLGTIKKNSGQIVFMNSSAGLQAKGGVGQYAASKYALKAIAESLREEINSMGVRVLSIYPGRTATAMQAAVHEMEKRPYSPEKFLQPSDIAEVVVGALSLPRSAEVTDIQIRPFKKFD